VELLCGEVPEMTGMYAASLDMGRKASAAKRWADAIAAFRRVLSERKDDPSALSELSWALLQSGDAQDAVETAERGVAVAADPKQKAAAHYNAGRAAEALGNLAAARTHYETSLALRGNETVSSRLAKLAASGARALPKGELMKECQGQASIAAVCECLGNTAAFWGASAGLGAGAFCEVTESRGKAGQLVSVWSRAGDLDSFSPGRVVVLVARIGSTWSALQVAESSDDVDHTETPQSTDVATVMGYEELPYRGGTMFWVQTKSENSEWSVGEQDVRGHAGLTLCSVPGDSMKGAPACLSLPLAEWDFTLTPDRSGDNDRCEVRKATKYRVTLDSQGHATMLLEAGTDGKSAVGRYEF
jgi:hypothetical protein